MTSLPALIAQVEAKGNATKLERELAAALKDALLIMCDLVMALDDAMEGAVTQDWSRDDYDQWHATRGEGERFLERHKEEKHT